MYTLDFMYIWEHKSRGIYTPWPFFFFFFFHGARFCAKISLIKATLNFYQLKVIPSHPWLMRLRCISNWKWHSFPVELGSVEKQDVSVHFSKCRIFANLICLPVCWGGAHFSSWSFQIRRLFVQNCWTQDCKKAPNQISIKLKEGEEKVFKTQSSG